MPKIFISYKHYDKRLNNRDETVARKLYDKLRAAGFECWMDKMNMPVVTESWINNIVTAIKQCDLVVMVISEHAQNSDTIRKRELRVISQHKKPIIPFRIDQSELLPEFEWEISSNQWVEAWDDYESKIDEVISKLRLQLGDPHTPNLENISDKESTSVSDTNENTRTSDNKSDALDYLKDNGTIEDITHLEHVKKNGPNQNFSNSAESDIEIITIKNKRILFFNDEPFISISLVHGLSLFGWEVTLVSEAEDLFRELKNNQYDVIIMDIMAPIPPLENEHVKFTQKEIDEMDGGINTGVVLAKKLLSKAEYANTPILFLSARRNPLLENHELNNYKCHYIRKPALASDICNALQDLLNV